MAVERLRAASLWLLLALSSLAFIEPSPYDVYFVFVFALFAVTGLRFSTPLTPLLFLLIALNFAGAASLLPYLTDRRGVAFVAISFYLTISAVFFAALMLEDTERRLRIIRNGWIWAALLAAVCGIAGYANIGGTADIFTRFYRAAGTFKDPNVFGPYLVVPAVLILERFMSGTLKRPILSAAALLILLIAIFLSFSRGAWAVLIASGLLTGLLLLLTTPSLTTRLRILGIGLAALLVIAGLIAAALSIDSVRELFEVRFALLHNYDSGPRGRFGKVADLIALLLERPGGIGPMQLWRFFAEAPHNVFLNTFVNYGWAGGAIYICLIALTLRIGWATVWIRTPWQSMYIAYWASTFCQIVQGLTIDTDHWRHLWLLIGITWGIAAASQRFRSRAVAPRSELPQVSASLAR